MPEPMNDNARIVREELYAAGTWDFPIGRALSALTALESELATTKAELARAREEDTQAARDVLAERRRQIEAEGWTPEHDDQHGTGELARAAACYAIPMTTTEALEVFRLTWPWDLRWWKHADRRRNLVKAGALILAEIERLDRAALAPEQKG